MLAKPIAVTLVGDGMVGKTCLLSTFLEGRYSNEYNPTVIEKHSCSLVVDGVEHNVTFKDTAGQEDYDKIRRLSYPYTDCFIICYSVSNRDSYKNILRKWLPEIKSCTNNVPIVLVGTKSDLRGCNNVSEREGLWLKKKIKAFAFIECSAKKCENLNEVFIQTVRAVVKNPRSGGWHKCCAIL